MTELKDLAVAVWRMEKWLQSADVDKKMAAKSSLRTMNSFLKDNKIEIQDPTGNRFDPGLNVTVLSNEAPNASDDELIIAETVKPIVYQDGSIILSGTVVLGTKIKSNPAEEEKVTDEIPKIEPNELSETATENNLNTPWYKKVILSIKNWFSKDNLKHVGNYCKVHIATILLICAVIFSLITMILSAVNIGKTNSILSKPTTKTVEGTVLPDNVSVEQKPEGDITIVIER